MAGRQVSLTDRLQAYARPLSWRGPPLLAELRAETAKLPAAGMQISPEQGQFMALLVELIGARRTLEVGTFTGYSPPRGGARPAARGPADRLRCQRAVHRHRPALLGQGRRCGQDRAAPGT